MIYLKYMKWIASIQVMDIMPLSIYYYDYYSERRDPEMVLQSRALE